MRDTTQAASKVYTLIFKGYDPFLTLIFLVIKKEKSYGWVLKR